MNSTKQFSQITLPGINPPTPYSDDTGIDTDSAYLEKLKALVDEEVKNDQREYSIDENTYIRYQHCLKAKQMLGKTDSPVLEELNYCFPKHDHTEWIKRQEVSDKERAAKAEQKAEQAGQVGRAKGNLFNPPTRQQAEERLQNPPKDNSDEIRLSKTDWEWLEKANHTLGGRLFYGCGVTPLFMELDLKLGISDSPHRRRLVDYLSLHCDIKTGITSEVTVGELSEKLHCGKDKIREGMKWLVKKGVLEYSDDYDYPRHYTTGVVFVLPFVKETYETKRKANALRTKTGISYRELWERRDEFGFGVKNGGEAEGEGVEPPSSSS